MLYELTVFYLTFFFNEICICRVIQINFGEVDVKCQILTSLVFMEHNNII